MVIQDSHRPIVDSHQKESWLNSALRYSLVQFVD